LRAFVVSIRRGPSSVAADLTTINFPAIAVLSLAIRALSPVGFAVLALTASTSLFAAPPAYDIEILRNLGNAPGQRSYVYGISSVTAVPYGHYPQHARKQNRARSMGNWGEAYQARCHWKEGRSSDRRGAIHRRAGRLLLAGRGAA
jgi:hypothetical protein